jgi:CDP-diacylglycerol--serine O-phosphatidyltransferase
VFTLQNGIVLREMGDEGQFIVLSEKLWIASLFIGLAALTDFLDGFVARLFNASSEMGKQLDSLSDLVSFGVAPALIVYQFLRMSFASADDGLDSRVILLMPAFIIAAAAAYRLARFNLDDSQAYGFKGVPVPAAGLLIASIPLIYLNFYDLAAPILLNKWFLYGLIIVISWLMISKLPLMAMKFTNFSVKNNLPKYILIVFAILSAVFLQWLAVPVIFIAYIILSLAFKSRTT